MNRHQSDLPKSLSASSARLQPLAISIMAFSALFFALAQTVADPDLWGHVRFGLDILESGEITRADPYSYLTSGTQWINHEWLSEVMYAWAYLHGGTPGIVLLKTVLGLLLVLLLYRYLRSVGLRPVRAWIVIFIAMLPVSLWVKMARPQNFTFLAFTILLLLLVEAERGEIRWLLAAIPLFAIWANLHGGILAGLGILAIWLMFWLLERCLKQRSIRALLDRKSLAAVAIAALAAAATLLNPYGPELLSFLLRTATVPRPEIVEWQPTQALSTTFLLLVPLLILATVSLVASRRQRSPTSIAMLLLALVLPFLAIRFIPVSIIIVLIVVAPDVRDAWERLDQRTIRASRQAPVAPRLPLAAMVAVASALAAVIFIGLAAPRVQCISLSPDTSDASFGYPVSATALLQESGIAGNLAVSFNWGEYVIWHLGPGIQVSMDGRRETVYSEAVYQMYRDFWSGMRDWQALLRDYDTQLVLIETGGPADNLMKLSAGWTPVYSDGFASLYVKQGSEAEQALPSTARASTAPAYGNACFP